MVNPDVKLTVRDYMSLPESEEIRYELIDGELCMVPSPKFAHQMISKNLMRILDDFVKDRSLGIVLYAPLDVVLSDEDVFQPDIMYISHGRADIITEDSIRGAPDLVVEILSPSTADRDRTQKRDGYSRSGVEEYWIVDPDARSIEVLRAGQSGFETAGVYSVRGSASSPLLRGLAVDVASVFASFSD